MRLYGLEIQNRPFGAASTAIGAPCRNVPNGGNARVCQRTADHAP
jgi:hypothetical protein